MKPQTRKDQIENCLVLLAEFEAMSPRKFVPLLNEWHCGSAACIGGWVAQHPHFQAKGVFPAEFEGAPCAAVGRLGDVLSGSLLANELFGDLLMFSTASSYEQAKGWRGKQIAINRLKRQLEELTS